ncbi:transglutaminase family protein [Paenibacillus oenotherae]|uniref:Transglutaminase family protein n=1 Tax=Paenibacillus oenotherae TaxID=1435645 RepID=A0ABS7D400_9BACL|nr:transglutaminase family protein [Paenibacillus oenotherae]MBW7474644.1 transglutaminase family protein [Paenibacillus oenotherae]
MRLCITHITQYTYGAAVSDSVNELRLTPFTNEQQSCFQHAIHIEPNASLFSYEDYFGNRVHAFAVNEAHSKLTITSQMTVATKESVMPEAGEDGMSPQEAWRWLAGDEAGNAFAEYLLPTDYTVITPDVAAYAGVDTAPAAAEPGDSNRNVFDWLTELCSRIRSEFVYDPSATDVTTVAGDMFVRRRGVCQDFAHLMIASCRARGVPARYVSGYHFVGDLQGGSADFEQATHAWVEAYAPGIGWCGFDPTNDGPVGERYVKLGHGRDYKDIVPVKGVYHGMSNAILDVTVDVKKV